MILRKISLSGWRCFADACAIGPFGDGLNVLHGPNGAGKSTLFHALVRGLLDKHNTKGESIKLLQPWNRELSPAVTIEYEHDGAAYRIRKQFLVSAKAELHRLEDNGYAPLAEGIAADNRVRMMLAAEDRRGGVNDPSHWGLAQILWAPQGRLELGELSSVARETLQQSLGAQVIGQQTAGVEQRIADRYERMFTATGKLRTGEKAPPLVALQAQLAQAVMDCSRLGERLAAFDAAASQIDALRLQSQQQQDELRSLEAQRLALQQKANEYQKLVTERRQYEARTEAARARHDNLQARAATIRAALAETEQCEKTLATLSEDSERLLSDVQQNKLRVERAQMEADTARLGRQQVQLARAVAAAASQYAATRQRLPAVEERLRQIAAAEAERDSLAARRNAMRVPSAKVLRSMEDAQRLREQARIELEASLITVTIEAEQCLTIETIATEGDGNRTLSSGETVSLRGSPQVVFRIPGFGVIRASGPTSSSDQLRKKLQQTEQQIAQLTEPFGTQDADELRNRCASAAELDQQLATVRTRLETLLNRQMVAAIQAEQKQLLDQLQLLLTTHAEWGDSPPNPEQLLKDANALEMSFTERIDAAEGATKLAVEAFSKASEQVARHEEQRKSALQHLQGAQQRLRTARDDGRTDVEREDALLEAGVEWSAAKGALRACDDKLTAIGSDPRALLDALQQRLLKLQLSTTSAAEQLHREQGKLESILAEAPYTALGTARERLAELRQQVDREQRSADAVCLLHATLARRKKEIVASLVEPVRLRTHRTLTQIGLPFDGIDVSESFAVAGVTPRVGGSVTMHELSGGEQEQLHFAVRLALADIASAERRQLVVLDDVFTFTDKGRLSRIAKVLAEAAERFQIILLTCHPERYKSLPRAEFFDVGELRSGGASKTATSSSQLFDLLKE